MITPVEKVTPTQVAEALIQIVEEISNRNPIVIEMDKDRLRKFAQESTERYAKGAPCGVMDGVSILIKDEIPTIGYPLTMGTSFMAEVITEDKVPGPVNRLLNEGALLIGKANQHEIGIGTTGGNILHGAARNPYNENYYTGGSSSGPTSCSIGIGTPCLRFRRRWIYSNSCSSIWLCRIEGNIQKDTN